MLAVDRRLLPPTDREVKLVEDLRSLFRTFQRDEVEDALLSETAWMNHTQRLSELVLNDDPRKFLRWNVINETMFVSHPEYIRKELGYLASLPDWGSRWRKAIKESPIGHPPPYLFYPGSSGLLIHHAYHLAQFEEKTGTRVDQMDRVMEFGGGYGSMCRLFHNLGFRGRYVIFDLPHFSALQQFFLKSIGIEVHSIDTLGSANDGVICVSDLEHLRLLHPSEVEEHNSMFIATWSISETPIKFRQSILPLITSFSAFLIAYQHQYGEVNNLQFFSEWKEGMKDIMWHDWQIGHLPGNNYLFGKRLTGVGPERREREIHTRPLPDNSLVRRRLREFAPPGQL